MNVGRQWLRNSATFLILAALSLPVEAIGPSEAPQGSFQVFQIASNDALYRRALASSDGLKIMDNNINRTYQDLRRRLSRNERRLLERDELAWMRERDRRCEPIAYDSMGGYIDCLIDESAGRIVVLERYLLNKNRGLPFNY